MAKEEEIQSLKIATIKFYSFSITRYAVTDRPSTATCSKH